ncbi:cytochrome c oxidase subunit NDUFA4-like [Rhinolophus ferrumequinum]|uniref:cytochrome c oxidase subunit NDUFA4-like n=1 Tax=Rhinolophus ferrumequinum TaxID=59479 RepID=UPI00140FE38C|nr:cytochrome c oxidase subunit NDUFA4-like [Rhinolophus ferrumequinum]
MLHQILRKEKKHPGLTRRTPPLLVSIGAGGTGTMLYVLPLASFNPDVCWDKKNNTESWNKLGLSDQYKFYSMNVDYSKLKIEGPDF